MSRNEPERPQKNGRGDNVHRFQPRRPPPSAREPAFNAPWPPLLLTVLLIGLYAAQAFSGQSERIVQTFGLVPAALTAGERAWTPLSHMLVHGFWGHAILNAVGILAFGTPVARWLGERGAAGPLRFFGFFVACGLLAGLGYVLLHPTGQQVLIGASGASAGLMGAGSRLLTHPGRLAPLNDRAVVALGLGWVAINVIFAVAGAIPAFGVQVGWEAHLIGYAAGLFGVAPFARLTRAR